MCISVHVKYPIFLSYFNGERLLTNIGSYREIFHPFATVFFFQYIQYQYVHILVLRSTHLQVLHTMRRNIDTLYLMFTVINLTLEHARKAQTGCKLQLYPFLNASLCKGGWSAPRVGRFTPVKE